MLQDSFLDYYWNMSNIDYSANVSTLRFNHLYLWVIEDRLLSLLKLYTWFSLLSFKVAMRKCHSIFFYLCLFLWNHDVSVFVHEELLFYHLQCFLEMCLFYGLFLPFVSWFMSLSEHVAFCCDHFESFTLFDTHLIQRLWPLTSQVPGLLPSRSVQ